MRIAFIITTLSFLITTLSGQIVNADGRGVIYNEESFVDLRLHTNGWSLSYSQADIVQYDRIKWQGIEFGEIKHPKQDRRAFDLLAFGATAADRLAIVCVAATVTFQQSL